MRAPSEKQGRNTESSEERGSWGEKQREFQRVRGRADQKQKEREVPKKKQQGVKEAPGKIERGLPSGSSKG